MNQGIKVIGEILTKLCNLIQGKSIFDIIKVFAGITEKGKIAWSDEKFSSIVPFLDFSVLSRKDIDEA